MTTEQKNALYEAQEKVAQLEAIAEVFEHFLNYPNGESGEARIATMCGAFEVLSHNIHKLSELLMKL